ncbi:HrpB1 family type III secretion system apparatus protein [Ralstonia solanacearum]|uniref:HrpB1 family type III secretion system apparatus protein n=2 Tax=Ralstonia solanacearum TaxID=305 RepID=A0AAW5ZTA2_RALSL|nr:HrpB1 family type III secretion system apparatus protein [Ralstonia solanacearum]AST34765.2 HrpB1 family type III secretion system apparatus protein [Ralstonia solanacearum]ATJ88566.1 type III effector HrpK [Ralstonia solanacearum]MDB0510183.1 HrpB1 family type III secretion system apparatus protein [Ralstonia solanacearum]MDB0514485.1 HrpB1 family type III secretion system apparatus protein [Ralstonia solanacearum]MDB0527079.1 HrpB1 family type III secretion system apparatus protein [Ralst
MEPIQCSNRLLGGLLEVLMYATRSGQFDNAQAMLVALRGLRPNFKELDLVEGWLLVGRHQYTDAARILRELLNSDGAPSVMPFASAMMALCLNALNDPEWHVHANEVLARDADPDSVTLVRTLLGAAQQEANGGNAAEASRTAAEAIDMSTFHTSHYFTRA